VGEIRGGTGLLAGIAFDADALAEDASLPAKAARAIRPHGVILRALGDALAVSPPLTIASDEIQLLHDAVRAGLDALVESRAAVA
jgi:adenosylmethionine-8-amino-7-oxononanoate aminotransferase